MGDIKKCYDHASNMETLGHGARNLRVFSVASTSHRVRAPVIEGARANREQGLVDVSTKGYLNPYAYCRQHIP